MNTNLPQRQKPSFSHPPQPLPPLKRIPFTQQLPSMEGKEENIFQKRELLSWQAREYEKTYHTSQWYIGIFLAIFFLVAYALFTNNLLMSILFIIFGVVFYLLEKKEPRIFSFSISNKGILANKQLHEFSSLESFWIFYEPNGKKVLSLKSRKKFLPYICLPLGNTPPMAVRQILLAYLKEERQKEGLSDALENIL